MSVGGDNPPFRAKALGYPSCFLGNAFSQYQQNLGGVKKNVTQGPDSSGGHTGYNGAACPTGTVFIPWDLDSNTGKSTVSPVPATPICAECQYAGVVGPLIMTNTFAACDALASVEVTNGGTGYTDGDVLSIGSLGSAPYPETIGGTLMLATFRVKVVGGVIQSATVVKPGVYSGIDDNALAAQTTASGGTGTGAEFTFTRKDAQFDFGLCYGGGWQAVTAHRMYHGASSFLLYNACNPCPTGQNTPAPSKYLTYNIVSTYQNYGSNGQNFTEPPINYFPPNDANNTTYADFATGSNTVAPLTGIITYDIAVFQSDAVAGYAQNGLVSDSSGTPTTSGTPPVYSTSELTFWGDFYMGFPACDTGIIPDGTDEEYWSTEMSDGSAGPSGLGPPSFVSSDYGPAGIATLYYIKRSATLTDTTYDWKYISFTCTVLYDLDTGLYWNPIANVWDSTPTWDQQSLLYYGGSISLTDANTGVSVVADAEQNLLETWKLTDAKLMPLYNGGFTKTLVKVTRKEVDGDVSPFIYNPLWEVTDGGASYRVHVDRDGNDVPLSDIYTGAIVGAPNPDGGDYPLDFYDNTWTNWVYEKCDGSDTSSWNAHSFGDWRSAHPNLPPRATQWTDAQEVTLFSTGRQRLSGVTPPNFDYPPPGVWVTKWIETSIRLPSFNHARPFGNDRWLPDGSAMACVLTFDGTSLATSSSSPSFTAGDTLAVIGTDYPGLYTYNSGVGPYELTYLAALPAELNPDSFVFPGYEGSGIVAKIKYQSVPPMAGRLAVSSITDNHDGTVTVSHASMPIINQAETGNGVFNLDLCDKQMTGLATNLTPSSLTADSFIATADFATVKNAAWLCLYGALPSDAGVTGVAHWYWDDDKGKGNYWLGEWFQDNGTPSDIIAVEKNKGFCQSKPWAAVLSPNSSDAVPNEYYAGERFDFTRSYAIDETCGQTQVLDVQQAMQDPMWVKPLTCPYTALSVCTPLVEARLILPGAHAAPDNGTGISQTESPPGFVDYTVDLTAAKSNPPNPNSQPTCAYAPTGVFIPCP